MTLTTMSRDLIDVDVRHGPCWPTPIWDPATPIRGEDPRTDDDQDGRRPRSAPTCPRSVLAMVLVFVPSRCFGCMWSETICCCELELCCKSGQDYLCCGCCALRFVSPEVCCKSQGQVCCCAGASGIPCDDEVPCMFGTCGIICYPGLNVCKTLGEIRRGGEGGDANDEPSASD
ncbi:unnamed protein product [Prorocentrum cordatum]|uniref:Uncharacterized protein n=1 Tax=Prorocentrum cordatum TaxID=2364126 RepID=A0ABN9Q1D3_9DINO|nr:unnamed protein product [Polarella glacialis]